MDENNKQNLKKVIFGIIIVGIIGGITIGFVIAYNNVKISNDLQTDKNTNSQKNVPNTSSSVDVQNSKNVNITKGGTYNLSGSYETITINTEEDVTLNLNSVEITSASGPAINVVEADTVTIILSGQNKITATTTEDLDGAIYSKADLVFLGTGSLEVKSNFDGIVSKDTLVIKNGTYVVNADDDGIRGKDSVEIENGTFTIKAGDNGIKSTNEDDANLGYIHIKGGTYNIDAENDGIHSMMNLTIDGGTFTITCKDDAIHANGMVEINNGTFEITAGEGIEATYVKINDGNINISASDDGINAGNKSDKYSVTIEINGGYITIKMGQGDTDGIDSNGNLYINGGTINVTGNSPFDYDGKAEYNGGTLIVNGEETDTITNQFGGGMPGEFNMNGMIPNMGGPQGKR